MTLDIIGDNNINKADIN